MKKIILFSVCLLYGISCFAQFEFVSEVKKEENKYVFEGNVIKIFAGQRIIVSTSNKTGKLSGLKLMDSSSTKLLEFSKMPVYIMSQNSQKKICIDFNILKDDSGSPMTILLVNNPYKGTLSYKARIFSRKSNQYVETSIMDVFSKLSGVESWPYEINDIILYDFELK